MCGLLLSKNSHDEDDDHQTLCSIEGSGGPSYPGIVCEEFDNCHEMVISLVIIAANIHIFF